MPRLPRHERRSVENGREIFKRMTVQANDASSSLSRSEQANSALPNKVDTLNRLNLTEVHDNRHVVVVVDVTGGGKSSTANTLRHSNRNLFEVS